MLFVVTIGNGSMDTYSWKLAEKLDVPVVCTDIYQKLRQSRNISWLSPRAIKTIWYNWRFARMLNKMGDSVHLPNQHLGRYGNFLKVPYIITVHDLIRYYDLEDSEEDNALIYLPNRRYRYYLNLDYEGIRKATRIIAVSQSTKDDLIEHLGIADERISVVYEGIDHSLFRPVSHRIYNHSYILFVGSEQPRKNFTTLLKAFSQLKSEPRFKKLKLVKVGKAGGRGVDFRSQTIDVVESLHLSSEVIFTDFVPETDLPAYYSGAEVFVLPSLYEGFGFPVLEAMACGCPVITSNTSSLPEVVGKAGIMVDPHNTDSLAQAMWRVLTDSKLRDNMIRKGLEQSKRFSWEKAAEQTLEVYNKVENR
ncbi:D-inositol-3-phosphate glycosyltransferase [subsurface metagenome]